MGSDEMLAVFRWVESEHEALEEWLDRELRAVPDEGPARRALSLAIEARLRDQFDEEERVLGELPTEPAIDVLLRDLRRQHVILLDRVRRLQLHLGTEEWRPRAAELRLMLRGHYEDEESELARLDPRLSG